MPRLTIDGVPPPNKVPFWKRPFIQKGDVWEWRINEWGYWDPDYLGRWEWDGHRWVREPEVDTH